MNTNNYALAKAWLQDADVILISASNGLSISEGYHIFADNEDFKTYFNHFRTTYGVRNIVQGLFYPYPNESERRAFYETVIQYMIKDYDGSEVFTDLKAIIGEKDYFVVTSNGDTHFQMNGFDVTRLFEIEGNFYTGLSGDMRHIEVQKEKFHSFLSKYHHKKVVVLELGIGMRNQMIKAPLMNLVSTERNFQYITLNLQQEIYIPVVIEDKSIALTGPINKTFKELLK
ncbi:hypothetical protein [Macrococcus animalis]|uniref:hypothetical protein n=1 Tax=Macrococcus animalis TaxID=3395467 RepID=UPI0039BE61EE